MKTLTEFNKKYEQIIFSGASEDRKTRNLAELMTEMERTFKIPALRNKEWESKNRSVIALYRKISISREF